MKKLKVLLASAAALCVVAPMAFSATVGTYVSEAKLQGTGTLTATLTIQNPAANTGFAWTNVKPGDGWAMPITGGATTYMTLTSNITQSNGAIRIYTDNKNIKGTNPPKVVPAAQAGNPAGLVSDQDTTNILPLCWRVVDVTTNTLAISQGTTGKPDRLYSAACGTSYPCFIWMQDASSDGFGTGDSARYCVIKDGSRGIQQAEDTWLKVASPDYIYIGAKFSEALYGPDASTPNTYATKIVVETFSE